MEKHKISKLNSNLALNKQNELFSKFKNFLAFISNNFERLCKQLLVSYFYNDLLSDIIILKVFFRLILCTS